MPLTSSSSVRQRSNAWARQNLASSSARVVALATVILDIDGHDQPFIVTDPLGFLVVMKIDEKRAVLGGARTLYFRDQARPI